MRLRILIGVTASCVLILGLFYWWSLNSRGALSLSSFGPQISDSGWNYRRLKELIIRKKLSRISDVLIALKAEDPELLTRYVAVYESNSGQRATRKKPRVIPFSFDGQLFFSFSGLKTDPGFPNLEVMDFNLNDGYTLFEIHFPAEGRDHLFTDAETDEAYEFAVFSKPNPNECLMCHNHIVRPIWAQYPKWPRVFGEKDDYYFYGGKSVVAGWMEDSRYQVLDREHPILTSVFDGFYDSDQVKQRSRFEKKDIQSYYRRNLTVSRIFSWQLSQLMVRDVSLQGPQALANLQLALSCPVPSSPNAHSSKEPQWLSPGVHSKILSSFLKKFEDGVSKAAQIQAALLPLNLTVRQYMPLKSKRDPEGFEDGAGGFRFLTQMIEAENPAAPRFALCDAWRSSVEAWLDAHPNHDLL